MPASKDVAEDIAARLLDATAISSKDWQTYPHGVLSTIAQYLNVETEYLRTLSVDGQACRSLKNTKVSLARSSHDTRTVFTFAHELAHIALRWYEDAVPAVRAFPSSRIERLCDEIAGAMVLPRPWVEASVDTTPSVAEIFAMAQSAHVSPTAVVVRLRSLGHELCFLRLRTLKNGKWIAASAVGIPHEVRRLISPDAKLRDVLDRAMQESIESRSASVVQRMPLLLRHEAQTVDVLASTCASDFTVHLLVHELRCATASTDGWLLRTKNRPQIGMRVARHLPGTAPPVWISSRIED